jgi:Holliday junction resolvase
MGKSSRDKGARGEREVCAIFREAGYDVNRTPNSGGLHIAGDVQGVSGYHVEVKRQETLHLDQWSEQAEAECGEAIPLVIYRRSGKPWRVSMRLSDWLEEREL